MRIRILVADESEAKLYDMRRRPEALQRVWAHARPIVALA